MPVCTVAEAGTVVTAGCDVAGGGDVTAEVECVVVGGVVTAGDVVGEAEDDGTVVVVTGGCVTVGAAVTAGSEARVGVVPVGTVFFGAVPVEATVPFAAIFSGTVVSAVTEVSSVILP